MDSAEKINNLVLLDELSKYSILNLFLSIFFLKIYLTVGTCNYDIFYCLLSIQYFNLQN